MSVLDLARPHLRALKPYSSARSLAATAEIFLDANESPRVLGEGLDGLNRYPAPQPPALVAEAARYYGVKSSQVLVTRGADEGIDLLVRSFVEPGRESVLITPPTYGVYEIAARLHGAGVAAAPLVAENGFAVDLPAILARPAKIVFLCTPNNPTATGVPLESIAQLAAARADKALIVVDEAYLEFSPWPSAAALVERFPNVVVLKTLSKAWGLAGARVGFLIADEELVTLLQTARAPYPISAAAAKAAQSVFNKDGEAAMRKSVKEIVSQRKRLSAALRALPCVEHVFPSEANFLLVRLKNKDAAFAALKEKGVLIRDRGAEPGLSGCVRITVGLPKENGRLLELLGERHD